MSNQKTTIYFVFLIVFAVLALVGWFVIRGQSTEELSPESFFDSMGHGPTGFFPVGEEPQQPQVPADATAPITILAPVPEGVGHSAQGWKKIKGTIPVVVQAADKVSRIVFYLDRNIVGEVDGPPFDFELDTTKYTDCMYFLRAKAYDAGGTELGEARSQVWIDNTPTNC